MRSSLTEKQMSQIQDYLDDGKDVKYICLTMGLPYNVVYYFREKSLINNRHLMSKKKHWTDEEVRLLQNSFRDLPEMWTKSKEFRNLCRELNRTKSSVEQKCKALGLSKKAIAMEPPAPPKRRRPDPVYTNSRTPYGIASELHMGNRIY